MSSGHGLCFVPGMAEHSRSRDDTPDEPQVGYAITGGGQSTETETPSKPSNIMPGYHPKPSDPGRKNVTITNPDGEQDKPDATVPLPGSAPE